MDYFLPTFYGTCARWRARARAAHVPDFLPICPHLHAGPLPRTPPLTALPDYLRTRPRGVARVMRTPRPRASGRSAGAARTCARCPTHTRMPCYLRFATRVFPRTFAPAARLRATTGPRVARRTRRRAAARRCARSRLPAARFRCSHHHHRGPRRAAAAAAAPVCLAAPRSRRARRAAAAVPPDRLDGAYSPACRSACPILRWTYICPRPIQCLRRRRSSMSMSHQ